MRLCLSVWWRDLYGGRCATGNGRLTHAPRMSVLPVVEDEQPRVFVRGIQCVSMSFSWAAGSKLLWLDLLCLPLMCKHRFAPGSWQIVLIRSVCNGLE